MSAEHDKSQDEERVSDRTRESGEIAAAAKAVSSQEKRTEYRPPSSYLGRDRRAAPGQRPEAPPFRRGARDDEPTHVRRERDRDDGRAPVRSVQYVPEAVVPRKRGRSEHQLGGSPRRYDGDEGVRFVRHQPAPQRVVVEVDEVARKLRYAYENTRRVHDALGKGSLADTLGDALGWMYDVMMVMQ